MSATAFFHDQHGTDHLADLLHRRPELAACREDLVAAARLLGDCCAADGQVLLAGNGGSAADAEHWAGELLKGFERRRQPRFLYRDDPPGLQDGLRVLPLTGFPAFATAMANDVAAELVFAQLVHVLGRRGDVFIGISTSGTSSNVCQAATVARRRGLRVCALTGADGGRLAALADVAIRVPATRTCEVQELHLPVYHCLCLLLEDRFFPDP